MNGITIIAIFGLSIVAFCFYLFFFYVMFGETKNKAAEPIRKYTNLLFRIKHIDSGWPCFVDRYYAEIYTILPYEEKVLMTTEQYYLREEAKEQAELIIEQLKQNI